MAVENPNLIWIDCEMTGLSLAHDVLVEIAVLVTDAELNVLGSGVEFVITAPQEKLDHMSPEVRTMHTESGLLPLIPSGVTSSFAEEKILEYLKIGRAHV